MTAVAFDAVARVAQLQSMFATLQTPPAPAVPQTVQPFAAQLSQATASPLGGPAPVAAAPAAGPAAGPATPFGAEIDAAAARHGVDPALLRGLVRQESGFDPAARSSAGALGLTQLMPGTARELGVTDPTDPLQALDGGARYLRQQLDRFGGDPAKALAAYNAGPGAVQKFGGVPPYAETQNYVAKVLAFAADYRGQGSAVTQTPPPTVSSSPNQWGTT